MYSVRFAFECVFLALVRVSTKETIRSNTESHSAIFFPFSTAGPDGRNPRIIAFSDASFGKLRNSGSVESFVGISGIPLKRKVSILRKGNIIAFHGEKISRVARSTAHAEGIALSNAADSTPSLQISVTELLSGIPLPLSYGPRRMMSLF